MKTICIVVAVVFAYLAIGAVVVGAFIRIADDPGDDGVLLVSLALWPIVAVILILSLFCHIAIKIGGKR